ncbi:MAG: hypothetical protein A4S09_10420 [Proteobacteria bacterium SG_bin7]|nr:MAG: hypothetical protein A4S09_10420 [Proteobacteria bacterium SG_bin7]
MCNWVGRFNFINLILIFALSSVAIASDQTYSLKWDEFTKEIDLQKKLDYKNGLSYIISGALALGGGIWGANLAQDGAEQGIYTIFQTIGIASIGYGAYTWKIGGEERSIYQTLNDTKLTSEQKSQFLKSYAIVRKQKEKQDRLIRSITHGLIATINVYNATQQDLESVKTGLYFIGAVNLLACASFTFEF